MGVQIDKTGREQMAGPFLAMGLGPAGAGVCGRQYVGNPAGRIDGHRMVGEQAGGAAAWARRLDGGDPLRADEGGGIGHGFGLPGNLWGLSVIAAVAALNGPECGGAVRMVKLIV